MASFYVRSDSTSDANAGTGPSTTQAVQKIVTALALCSAGDTVYVAPGTYRENVTPGVSGSAGNPITVSGDCDCAHFASADVVPTGGDVIQTAFLTNDTSAPSGGVPWLLAGKQYLTIQNLLIIGGTSHCVTCTAAGHDIQFINCAFWSGGGGTGSALSCVTGADAAANWLIDRCAFYALGGNACISIAPAAFAGAVDVDINFVIRNCVLVPHALQNAVSITPSAAGGAGKAYGVVVHNCTVVGGTRAIQATNANHSTANASTAYNNVLLGCGSGFVANTSGQITEDYNAISATTPRTNVSTGAHSVLCGGASGTYSVLLNVFHPWNGKIVRPWLTPMTGSPLLGFGNNATPTAPTVDYSSRVRPAGGSSASNGIGYLERHDTAAASSAANASGGVNKAYQLTGPGDQELYVPVDAVLTTLSILIKYDGSGGGSTYTGSRPAVKLIADGEIGITAETKTASTAANGAYETLTFTAFTPTGAGFVVLRFESYDTAGTGLSWVDTLAVS